MEPDHGSGFACGLPLLDATMIVAGSMIDSGISIVPADRAPLGDVTGWPLPVRVMTGLLTLGGVGNQARHAPGFEGS